MSEDQAVELLKRSWGIAPKQLLVSVPLEVLSRITFTTGFTVGLMTAYCQTTEDRTEADRLRRELSCLWSELYKVD